jgi:hypothetical protein
VRKGLEAPKAARETLSVLLDSGSTACPRTKHHEVPAQRGPVHQNPFSESCWRFVRKGLEGREAVAPRKKSMQSMGFFSWRDGTPAKPGRRLRRMRPDYWYEEDEYVDEDCVSEYSAEREADGSLYCGIRYCGVFYDFYAIDDRGDDGGD